MSLARVDGHPHVLHGQIGKLGDKYAASKDETVKAEIDRLTAELAKLPERREFYVRWAL